MASRLLSLALALGLWAAPAWGEERKPRKVALVVGVNKYDHDFSALRFAEADATALSAELKKADFEVKTLLGSGRGEARATKANVLAALTALLVGGDADKKMRRGDLVLVCLSGHGQTLGVKGAFASFFCPVDGIVGEADSLVAIDGLLEAVARLGARHLMLVDACRDIHDPNKGGKSGGIVRQKSSLDGSQAILFSCSDGEKSYEIESIGHGLFTHAVLSGLRGAAAANGKITWDRLVAHVGDEFDRPEFRRLLPKEAVMTPVQATGQIGRVELVAGLKIDVGPRLPPNTAALQPDPGSPSPAPQGGAEPARLSLKRGEPLTAEAVKKAQSEWAAHLGVPAVSKAIVGQPEIEFALIPPGTYHAGARVVTLTRPFLISTREVTQKQYAALAGANPAYFQLNAKGTGPATALRGVPHTDDFPVETVNFAQAMKFAKSLGGEVSAKGLAGRKLETRLPSEAEWEWACRAGTLTAFSAGAEPPEGSVIDVGGRFPRPDAAGGGKSPNAWGLHDLHGNVAEWCIDGFEADLGQGALEDPIADAEAGASAKRVVRGGSFRSAATACQSNSRAGRPGTHTSDDVGFRVVIVVGPK